MDSFKEELLKKKEELQNCQKERGLKSCLTCEEIKSCQIKKEYVKAVYKSMSHGKRGGFDF
jgi:hypothetical protein